MSRLRAAVIGVGYLGRFHAQKYAAHPEVDLVAVVDADPERAAAVAAETGTRPHSDYRALLGEMDLASVVVPTAHHHAVGAALLDAGVHVLMEKPITSEVAEARDLVRRAEAGGRVLQVGHLERFKPVVRALMERVERPMFIEAHRLAPFKWRGTDINVVLDLMVHDIDLALTLVDSPVVGIQASGVPVLTDHIDIANARIQFENGCVANLTASRISQKTERRLRLFQKTAYLAADMGANTLDYYYRSPGATLGEMPDVAGDRITLPGGDAIEAEVDAFIRSVRSGSAPVVSGLDGLRALETALEVVRQLQ
ncbi:Gfo/Idh/MocA family protein [Alkalilimnicola sp. S0819]|uniref:Gfo/Idh/MocA family protein n=1 Tax=Alkalilimnicola sp. S0819 TaxID=2613922 RepID=UPI0012629470|nr:Gfo/Idh/MocA family oxidoreductase [Alkalilimnicola sp. S0819]KAB7627681.1 Gfo/Idh/MocA family oxidoreductase [Alkalilimnicola sp. S0819]MPQ15848.1 gfo/Idh/MocA family oxidoreductase [Alkalilimnicola sp. S0819]